MLQRKFTSYKRHWIREEKEVLSMLVALGSGSLSTFKGMFEEKLIKEKNKKKSKKL